MQAGEWRLSTFYFTAAAAAEAAAAVAAASALFLNPPSSLPLPALTLGLPSRKMLDDTFDNEPRGCRAAILMRCLMFSKEMIESRGLEGGGWWRLPVMVAELGGSIIFIGSTRGVELEEGKTLIPKSCDVDFSFFEHLDVYEKSGRDEDIPSSGVRSPMFFEYKRRVAFHDIIPAFTHLRKSWKRCLCCLSSSSRPLSLTFLLVGTLRRSCLSNFYTQTEYCFLNLTEGFRVYPPEQ